ncbi:flagellar filament capping protein FliD [Pseudomonas sp. ABC1]|uniref:flagellar filament capping protein FliD n=1 Tax=Pseudomonas sp. ABC1 TaxID=2748080 RepID=UPI0015C3D9CF|nr:flagellar filament capping protein FliD [Pseudomonas sp. ABC1]QLF92468.1 flagellar filament capping protein FliD [Pseudomonas sp. ABC1]
MAGITGIGSGMNIDTMVSTLIAAEKAPKEAQLTRLTTANTTKITALGTLRNSLTSFQSALKDLNDVKLFQNRSGKSSNEELLTVTADKTAQSGSYAVKVEQLATGSKTATAVLDDDFKTGSAGQLTVKVGSSDSGVSVDIAEGASLSDVRDAINAALKDKGVSANLLTNPSNGETRLVLSSTNTGADKDVLIEADGVDSRLNIGSNNVAGPGAGVLERAQNAKFTVDGLSLESATNKVEGAIPDVTLNLAKADKDKTTVVTVGQDIEGVTANIKKFVSAYNDLVKTANSLTKVTKVGEDGTPLTGGLVGDSSVRNILSGLQNELVSAAGGDVRLLSQLGITTQQDGTLGIEDDELKAALEKNFDAVGNFFAGENGLMTRMNDRVDGFNQTGGVLAQRVSGLEASNKDITAQREKLTLRIESMTKRLYAQFNAMDSMVARLTNTSNSLASALSNLPGVVKKSS